MAVLKNVEVRWCHIQQPDTQFDPMWHVEVVLSKEQAADLLAESKKHHDKGINIKNKDGELIYTFSRKTERADGSGPNKQPACKTTQPDPVTGKPMDFDGLIGNGSICNINYSLFKWDNKYGSGVKADFKGIQVVDLVEYGAPDGDEFNADDTTATSTQGADEYDDDDFS